MVAYLVRASTAALGGSKLVVSSTRDQSLAWAQPSMQWDSQCQHERHRTAAFHRCVLVAPRGFYSTLDAPRSLLGRVFRRPQAYFFPPAKANGAQEWEGSPSAWPHPIQPERVIYAQSSVPGITGHLEGRGDRCPATSERETRMMPHLLGLRAKVTGDWCLTLGNSSASLTASSEHSRIRLPTSPVG